MSLCCCLNSEDEDARCFLDLPPDTEIPVKNRKQTDFQCFIILVVFFSSMVISVIVAGSQGDIRRFIHGYDDKGNVCGVKNNPIEGVLGSGLDMTNMKFLRVREHCKYGECSTERECVEICKDGYTYFIIPRCIKNADKTWTKKLDVQKSPAETKKTFLEIVYWDISLCWKEIIVLCLCSIGLSGLILTVLRLFPRIVVKIILTIISITVVGGAVITWIIKFTTHGAGKMNWLYIAIVLSVFAVVFFILLFKMRNKIKLIEVLFEEGGKCIKDIPTMLLQPVLTYLTTALFAGFVCFGLVCFQTSGKAETDSAGKVSFPNSVFFQVTNWFLFFAYLWLSQFFLACQNLVIAGAVSSWYFSRVKGKLISPVWRSFKMIVKHHLGSAAFGSLLIAIIKAIRFIAKMMEGKADENPMAALFWALLQCLLACLESVVRILNKTAYVMIVLFGKPFCSSARTAFACLTLDSSNIALIIGVGTFILTAIQLLITVSVSVVGIGIFMNIEGVQIFWIPAIVVFVLSYLCCYCFFSVYEMAIDTLILCFCVDHQMNNGLEKPYYMNQNLMILLNKGHRNRDEAGGHNMGVVV